MEKSRKINLKKTMLMSMMGMSLLFLAGCGEKIKALTESDEKLKEDQAQELNRVDEHAIVNIGDNTIIFRSCDENYNIYASHGYINIYDEKGNLIDTIYSKNGSHYKGDDQGMVDIENDLLENGAYLYQYKMGK